MTTPRFDIGALRAEEFPWTAETIYLNAASTGPLPARTVRALDAFNRLRATPGQLTDSRQLGILAAARQRCATLINAEVGEIALATSTSFGINVATNTLPLAPGDVIVVSDREFPANIYPWLRLRDRGIAVEIAPTTAEGWPDEAYLVQRMQDPRVRVLAVSYVQFSNGYLVDLDRLSAGTRATNTYLVVDAIQGVGQVPLDVRRTPVDILTSGGQKWLLSPWGSAFTYVRRELVPSLVPRMVGWMAFEGTDDFSRLTTYNDTFRADARRFEVATLPYQDFEGMNASLDLVLSVGVERIRDHVRCVAEPVRDWATRRGVRITSPQDRHASGIICVAPPNVEACHAALRAAGVVASLREGAIRLSPHMYNTVDELARTAELLDRAL